MITACSGDDGAAGRDGRDAPDPLDRDADLPGVVVTITALEGASGADGSFRSGDRISVRFVMKQRDGAILAASDLSRGAIMVSGPTFNYQRVIASQSDLLTAAVAQADGSYRYTFATPIPDTYLEPLNYTGRFTAGVLAGQALLAGTYTVGIEARRDVVIGETSFRDVGNATSDFRFGGAASVDSRAVVANANCNTCHTRIQAHGANRTNVTNCLLCHTAGAEDGNDPSVLGGTPDITIEFKVMIHKIHSGRSLPSVQGVSTLANGVRDYTVAPKKYQIVGFRNSVHDYSDVAFPSWPSLYTPMPRDSGHGMLGAAEQAAENAVNSGPVACGRCHGDPDGSGPEPAPAQGELIYSQPTRAACGSCHDDWVWDRFYKSNGLLMPPQLDDAACVLCHGVSGSPLAVKDAHVHPLADPVIAPGLHFKISEVKEAGTHDNDGTVDPGEKIAVTFTIENDAGGNIPSSAVSRVQAVVTGPTSNPNLLYSNEIPTAALGAGPTYALNLPQEYRYEYLGDSTGTANEIFTTANKPHWNVSGATTTVYVRTGTTTTTTLAAGAAPAQNYVDVVSSTGLARNEIIVVSDGVGGSEEYLRIQYVEGNRLWFSSLAATGYKTALVNSHLAGATVAEVTLEEKAAGSDYSLNTTTGEIQEAGEFGDGNAVVVTYTSDFVVPALYPGTLNESPSTDSSFAKWTGLPVVSGTYTVGIHARRSFVHTPFDEPTQYSEGSKDDTVDFRFGSATALQKNRRIDSAAACNRCHDDLQFHGGNRRGYATCLMCHGVAGAEDRPQYVAANAPATSGVTIDFRSMIHKIHHGKALANGSTYQIVGFGSGYPNNYRVHTYEHVGFPVLPAGTQDCASCHGAANTAWLVPAPRKHPGGQPKPSRVWRESCNSCHDSDAATAHIDANTSPGGAESCEICHGTSEDLHVRRVHKVR